MTDPKALIERLSIDHEDCRTGARVRKAYETLCHERAKAAQALRDLTAENARLKALGDGLAEAGKALEPYLDAIICFASTQGEHEPNRIAAQSRAALAAWEKKDA